MKYICVFFMLLFIHQLYAQKKKDKKPNIILFFVDDMGWQDTSVPFYTEVTNNNKKYHTPNMLKWPDWNYNGMSPVAGVKNTVVVTPLPQLLKENGYYTIHVGKGHFAAKNSPASELLNIGFMKNIAGNTSGGPGSYLGTENFGDKETGSTPNIDTKGLGAYFGKDIFLTEVLSLEAIKALDKPVKEKKPFFL